MCDNTALSFYLRESDKRQESRLAEQSNAVDQLKKKKNIYLCDDWIFSMTPMNLYKSFRRIAYDLT